MILFFPAIDGCGSTFTLNLLRDLYAPQFYYHLDTEDTLLRMMHKPGRHLVHTGFWNGNHTEGLHVPVAKAEEWMGRADRIVCSVRDPLKVLATDATMGQRCGSSLDKFLVYADWARRFDIFFLPVDVDKNFDCPGRSIRIKRGHLVAALAGFLDTELHNQAIEKWQGWPVFNESRQFRPKREPRPEDVERLRGLEGVLRPVLEDVGYRGLSWWREP